IAPSLLRRHSWHDRISRRWKLELDKKQLHYASSLAVLDNGASKPWNGTIYPLRNPMLSADRLQSSPSSQLASNPDRRLRVVRLRMRTTNAALGNFERRRYGDKDFIIKII
ncbi:hypothetical protein Vretimale_17064, partial [Volvox reticuliferus]